MALDGFKNAYGYGYDGNFDHQIINVKWSITINTVNP